MNRTFAVMIAAAAVLALACSDAISPDARAGSRLLTLTTGVPQVSTGYDRTCTVRVSGVVQCWTVNTLGQGPVERTAPSGSYVQVSVGIAHTCALVNDGSIDCFGHNTAGEAIAQPAATGSFVQVESGGSQTCALRTDGVVECWGQSVGSPMLPAKTAAVGVFTQITVSWYQRCALRSDGEVECWGVNTSAQPMPALVPSTGDFIQISAAPNELCGLLDNGTIQCVGQNSPPASWSASAGTFTRVASGDGFTCGLTSAGAVQCTGTNWGGQAPPLRTASAGATYVDLSAGSNQACAVRSDDLVECWGYNGDGQAISDQRIDFTSTPPTPRVGYVPAAVSTSGLPVSLTNLTPTICPMTGNAIGETKPGTCTIEASNAGTPAYRADTTSQSFTVVYSLPFAPTGIGLASGRFASAMDVNWTDNSVIETAFQLQRRTRNGDGSWGAYQTLVMAAGNVTSYEDITVVQGANYQYRLRSCTPAGCSAWLTSAAKFFATTLPASPALFAATPASLTEIALSWSSPASNETRFELLRRVRTGVDAWGGWIYLTTTAGSATTFSNTGLAIDALYQYRIQGCNSAGCSPAAVSGIVTNQTAPAAPTGISGSVAGGSMDLSWTDASGNETVFEIYRRVRPAGSPWQAYARIATTLADATGYSDSAIVTGTRYLYRVRACNAAGCSAYATTGILTP